MFVVFFWTLNAASQIWHKNPPQKSRKRKFIWLLCWLKVKFIGTFMCHWERSEKLLIPLAPLFISLANFLATSTSTTTTKRILLPHNNRNNTMIANKEQAKPLKPSLVISHSENSHCISRKITNTHIFTNKILKIVYVKGGGNADEKRRDGKISRKC